MTKGLKALEFVKTMPHENGGEVGIYATDKWATIEKELKENEKNKKLLKIIKAIDLFSVYESIEGKYYLETNIGEMELMKDNYDLLKEVLSHEK